MDLSLTFIKNLICIFLINSLLIPSSHSNVTPFLCQQNVANFDFQLQQPLDSNRFVKGWGPARNTLQLNPEFTHCFKNAGANWQRQRILAATDYWIKKKLNYCHHYVPNYATPIKLRHASHNKGGYCSTVKNIEPGSSYYQQQVRWNYNGIGTETLSNWINNSMWYGLDCSNYTAFIYNFALGLIFSSRIEYQAGQRVDQIQTNLSPNQQTNTDVLDNPKAAGKLVCKDNTLEYHHSCTNHGGYLSVIDNLGRKHPGSVLSADLATLSLQPGDLLFIASPRPNSINVVHVAIWTGKQVGYGSNDIHPDQIAPNKQCPQKEWMPRIGDWTISDSHYQGPDYRIITPCYYLNNLWGVRRVIY